MGNKTVVTTSSAPSAIGTYSQAIKTGSTVYISGQIPLDPATMEVVDGDFRSQVEQVFRNLAELAKASGGSLSDAVRVTVFMTDLSNFAVVNEVMSKYVPEPYPARAAVQVSALPKAVDVEVDAILELD